MKFNADQLDTFAPETQGNYFTLKNDGDSCRVRILYETAKDVNFYGVHKIKPSSGPWQTVECLRETNDDPMDMCPICSGAKDEKERKCQQRFWIPMYIVEDGSTVIWDRGIPFFRKQLLPLMVQHNKPFCGHIFNIIRHGVAGDTNTTYELVEESFDETVLDDFDEIPTVEGSIVVKKSFEELSNYVKTGSFDSADAVPFDETVVRRRPPISDENTPQRRGTMRPNMV